jgi:hypothetical protein
VAVFLGYTGRVELRRSTQDAPISATLRPSDVNASKNRFSFDFELGTFLSGDQVEISTADGTLLDFIAASGWPTNTQYRDGVWFLSVDEVGGISLYRNFDDAINGESTGRVDLLALNRVLPINIRVVNSTERILGQVRSFEFNTERNAVDVTALSEDFRRQYSSLISGSGRIECFFDYQRSLGDPAYRGAANGYELSRYMNELVLRTKNGSEFNAKLYLVGRGAKPLGRAEDTNDEVYYDITGVITNIGMAFSPEEPITATIDFVTTGRINFRVTTVSNYLIQENADRILLEANQSGFIELED